MPFGKINSNLNILFEKNPSSIFAAAFFCFLLGVLLCSNMLFGILNSQKGKTVPPLQLTGVQYDSKNLFIVDVSPLNGSVVLPESVIFTFSEPVDVHMLSHNFTITPKIEGDFTEGPGPNQITFRPKSAFERNISYSITIDQALTSLRNKPLLAGFGTFFSTSIPENGVQFIADHTNGRLLSFPAGKESELTVEQVNQVESVDVSVFRSDVQSLLAYMQYEQRKKELNSTNSYTIEEYIKQSSESSTPPIKQMSFKTEKATISVPSDKGIYYFQAKSKDKVVGSSFVVVTSLGVVFRQDDSKVILSAFDLLKGTSVQDKMNLAFYNMERGNNLLLSSDLLGTRSYDLAFEKRLDLVVVRSESDTAIIPVKLTESQADIRVYKNLDKAYQAFVYTDRPIYKPDDTVYYRGIVRQDKDALYSLPPLSTLKIKISNEFSNDESSFTTVPVDSHGVFSGSFALKNAKEEERWLSFGRAEKVIDVTSNTVNISVADYIKPEFDIAVEPIKKEYLHNEKIQYKISGKYFDGKPLVNYPVTHTAYSNAFYEPERSAFGTNFNITSPGGMCGVGFGDYLGAQQYSEKPVTLDNNGSAVVDVPPVNDDNSYLSQEMTLVAEAKDAHGNKLTGAASSIVHSAEFSIFFPPLSNSFLVGDSVNVPFYIEKLDGTKLGNKEVEYSLTTFTYNGNVAKDVTLLSGKASTSDDGYGVINFVAPDSGGNQYAYVIIKSKDDKGNVSENRQYVNIYKDAVPEELWWLQRSASSVHLKLRSARNSYRVGETIEIEVESPDTLDALLTMERGRVYVPQIVHLVKGANTVRIPVTGELSPSITSVFSYFQDGKYYSEGLVLNIPAMHKLLNVAVSSDKSKYSPSEQALLHVQIKDFQGNGIRSQFSLGIVDKAIYALRKSANPPLHSSFFFFRPRTTNASSSLTAVGNLLFGGGGGGGGEGGGSMTKNTDTLLWLPNLETDDSGNFDKNVDLKGLSTTWRAQVYAATDATDLGEGSAEFIVAEQ